MVHPVDIEKQAAHTRIFFSQTWERSHKVQPKLMIRRRWFGKKELLAIPH